MNYESQAMKRPEMTLSEEPKAQVPTHLPITSKTPCLWGEERGESNEHYPEIAFAEWKVALSMKHAFYTKPNAHFRRYKLVEGSGRVGSLMLRFFH